MKQEENPKISVIVPVFRVEKYLRKCVDSILAQTYSNIEIILVNDGSDDNCPAICDEYAEKSDKIQVIHKENAGLAQAWIDGLDVSTGDYIGFVDSDDYIDSQMYEKLMDTIQNKKCDIASCGLYVVDEGGAILGASASVDAIYIKEENIDNCLRLLLDNLFNFPENRWDKLYKKELLERSVQKLEKRLQRAEDLYINLYVFDEVSSVGCVDYKGYYYLQRTNTIMSSNSIVYHYKTFMFLIDCITEQFIESLPIEDMCKYMLNERILPLASQMIAAKENDKAEIFLSHPSVSFWLNHESNQKVSKSYRWLANMMKKRKFGRIRFLYKLRKLFKRG